MARVGYFQLFPDSLTTFNEDCINTISEANDYPKPEVGDVLFYKNINFLINLLFSVYLIIHFFFLDQIQVMWRAPQAGSGCVIFTAMILENNVRWYAEDGALVKTVCETANTEVESANETKCCACDEAKYSVNCEIFREKFARECCCKKLILFF